MIILLHFAFKIFVLNINIYKKNTIKLLWLTVITREKNSLIYIVENIVT